MDMDHLGLKSLEVLLQALQLICSFVIRGDGVVDHAEGANDEFQSHRDEADYASRQAEWVHRGSEALWGAIGERSGLKSRENASAYPAWHTRAADSTGVVLGVFLSLLHLKSPLRQLPLLISYVTRLSRTL